MAVKKYGLGPSRILVGASTTITTTLAASANPTDTELELTSTADFNQWGGIVELNDGTNKERVYYSTKDDATNKLLGCIRGFDGTTALAWTYSTATPINVTELYKDLGDTEGGVKFTASESSNPIHTDQAGDTPVDEVIAGTNVTIDASLAQMDLETFALIFKTSVQTNADGSRYVLIKPNVGVDLLTLAVKVRIIPYTSSEAGAQLSTNPEDYINLRYASIVAKPEITYDKSTQRVLAVQFKAFPDATGVLGAIGADPEA